MEDIKLRIAKLLAMGEHSSGNENEQAVAMKLAAKLMLEHGITRDQVAVGVKHEVKAGKHDTSADKKFMHFSAMAAAKLYGCSVLLFDGGRAGFQFVGRQDNLDAAYVTYELIVQQIERFYKQALPRGLTKADRAEFRRTFKDACAVRVGQRAAKIMEELSLPDDTSNAASSRALVVVNHRALLKQEVDSFLATIKLKKPKTIAPSRGAGTGLGLQAGDKVKLRQELGRG